MPHAPHLLTPLVQLFLFFSSSSFGSIRRTGAFFGAARTTPDATDIEQVLSPGFYVSTRLDPSTWNPLLRQARSGKLVQFSTFFRKLRKLGNAVSSLPRKAVAALSRIRANNRWIFEETVTLYFSTKVRRDSYFERSLVYRTKRVPFCLIYQFSHSFQTKPSSTSGELGRES